MRSIREMDEEDRNRLAASGWEPRQSKKNKLKSSMHKSTASKRNRNHQASVDSIDYDLSSSDDEQQQQQQAVGSGGAKPTELTEEIDMRHEIEITIARDRLAKGVSPSRTDLSDAKTSDITKVEHVRDLGGIRHETGPSHELVSQSQKLDTRSDL